MFVLGLIALLGSSPEEIPTDIWRCANQVEVWCTADGCAASAPDEVTPMDIWAKETGELSVCAYSGCWEAKAEVVNLNGRLLWAADQAPFSTSPDGAASDLTLVINKADGVGFVRVIGLATPLLCTKRAPAVSD